LGKGFRSWTDEVDVGTFVEDEAGGLDGIADALDAGDAAGAKGGAVHDKGVELDAAVASEEGAAAGVEGGVVFEGGDGGLDGVECGAAVVEDAPALLEGIEDALLVGIEEVRGDVPGAAVDEEDGRTGGRWGRRTGHGGKEDCTVLGLEEGGKEFRLREDQVSKGEADKRDMETVTR